MTKRQARHLVDDDNKKMTTSLSYPQREKANAHSQAWMMKRTRDKDTSSSLVSPSLPMAADRKRVKSKKDRKDHTQMTSEQGSILNNSAAETALQEQDREAAWAPGAVRVPGINSVGDDDDVGTILSNTESSLQPAIEADAGAPFAAVSARLVDTEEENRAVREEILQNAAVAQVVVNDNDDDDPPNRKRKLCLWGAILVVVVAVGVTLGVVLPNNSSSNKDNQESSSNQSEPTTPVSTPTPMPSLSPSQSPTVEPCTFCWTQSGQTIQGEASGARSGASVSMSADGSVMAVGEPGVDRVRVFERHNNASSNWTLRDPPIQGPVGTSFGAAVALSEDGRTVAVGAPTWQVELGMARVYRWMLPHQVWQMLHQCNGSRVSRYGMFYGTDVALSASGKTLVATGPFADPNLEIWASSNSELDALERWDLVKRWYPFDQSEYSYVWPTIVGLSGISVLAADDSSARVFNLNAETSSTWPLVGGDQVDGSSAVLSRDATVLAVATPYQGPLPDDTETTIYKLTNDTWVQWGTTLQGFPLALSFEGSVVVIATPLQIDVYKRLNDSWTKLGEGIALEANSSSVTASSLVAISSEGISFVIGEPSTGEEEQGSVKTYTYRDPSGESIPVMEPIVFPQCQEGFTSFRFEFTPDLAPEDHSWRVVKDGIGDPILMGDNYTVGLIMHVYEACLPSSDCYQLRASDFYQYGLCCNRGEGGYTMYLDEEIAATTEPSNDVPYGVYSHWFGNCSNR